MKGNFIDYLLSVDENHLTETDAATLIREYTKEHGFNSVVYVSDILLRWKNVVEYYVYDSSKQRDAIAQCVRELVLSMYRKDKYRIFREAIVPVLINGKAYYLEYTPPLTDRIAPPIPQIFLRENIEKKPFPEDDLNPQPGEKNEVAIVHGILAYIIHYAIMEKRYSKFQTLDFLEIEDLDYVLSTVLVHKCIDEANPTPLADMVCLKWEKPWKDILADYVDSLHPISKDWILHSPNCNPVFAEDDKVINEIFVCSRDNPLMRLHDTILWTGFTTQQQFYIDNYYQQFIDILTPFTDKDLIQSEAIKDLLKRAEILDIRVKNDLFNYINPDISPSIQKEIDDAFRMCADANSAPLLADMVNLYASKGYLTFKSIFFLKTQAFIDRFNAYYECDIKYNKFWKCINEKRNKNK